MHIIQSLSREKGNTERSFPSERVCFVLFPLSFLDLSPPFLPRSFLPLAFSAYLASSSFFERANAAHRQAGEVEIISCPVAGDREDAVRLGAGAWHAMIF